VFFKAIQDLSISLIQTLNEADSEIAALGSGAQNDGKSCYVFSNDTDFCIYNVNVVSLDSTLSSDLTLNIGKKKTVIKYSN